MTHAKTPYGPWRDWVHEAEAIESSCGSVSVGGLAADLGLIQLSIGDEQRAFGRLINFARRAKGLSQDQLSKEADVDLDEIISIELYREASPRPRTVFQLARTLNLPSGPLTEVAGLTKPRNDVSAAALQFAARSEPTSSLTPAEREAFEEFVKVLIERSDGR